MHLMEALNEPSPQPNAAQVDSLMTLVPHVWVDAHMHTLMLTRVLPLYRRLLHSAGP